MSALANLRNDAECIGEFFHVRQAQAGAEAAAVVFGPERGGLSREELRSCHLTVGVPTNPQFPVLNLAQAVGIVLASLARDDGSPPPPSDPMDLPAPHGELAAAIARLRIESWRATYRGLVSLDLASGRSRRYLAEPGAPWVLGVVVDRRNRIWIARHGLSRFDRPAFCHPSIPKPRHLSTSAYA